LFEEEAAHSLAEAEDEVGGEGVLIGEAADAVGAEEFTGHFWEAAGGAA
jgi:hypothetical protein